MKKFLFFLSLMSWFQVYSMGDPTSSLCGAIEEGKTDRVRDYLVFGADANGWDASHSQRPLHIAVRKGNIEAINLLLKNRACLEYVDCIGCTALHRAVEARLPEVIIFLLSNGANINACNPNGWTPLYYAVANKDWPTVAFLCGRGADLNARAINGMSVMHVACGFGHLSIVGLLAVLKPAMINDLDAHNDTPLHYALYYALQGNPSHLGVVYWLLRQGANTTNKNNGGIAAHNLIIRSGHTHLLMWLHQFQNV